MSRPRRFRPVGISGPRFARTPRAEAAACETVRTKHTPSFSLRLATYNVHSCIDTARKPNMEKTARAIAEIGAEVIALQEVDADKPRTGGVQQAAWLADRLGMDYRFYPVVRSGDEKYGLAVLSKLPLETVRCGRLPALRLKKPAEVRGAMWLRLKMPKETVNLVNTHLGLRAAERRLQIDELLGGDWLGGLSKEAPVVFCGDFNAGIRSYVYRRVCRRFSDVRCLQQQRAVFQPTFLSFYPIFCLDHIFASSHFSAVRVKVPSTRTTRRASDHLPLFAQLDYTKPKSFGSE